MSRSYLLYADFGEMPKQEFQHLLKFYYKWCSKNQVWKTYWGKDGSYIYAEMGCSSGIAPEDTATNFYNELINNKFPIDFMCFWSLHTDNSIKISATKE